MNKKKHISYVNVNLMLENETQMENGIIINIDVSANFQENIVREKQFICGILIHELVKMLNI